MKVYSVYLHRLPVLARVCSGGSAYPFPPLFILRRLLSCHRLWSPAFPLALGGEPPKSWSSMGFMSLAAFVSGKTLIGSAPNGEKLLPHCSSISLTSRQFGRLLLSLLIVCKVKPCLVSSTMPGSRFRLHSSI